MFWNVVKIVMVLLIIDSAVSICAEKKAAAKKAADKEKAKAEKKAKAKNKS